MSTNEKQYWDYVDIGTSDFDTSADYAPASKVLLVEPLDFYLNKFLNMENVSLCNCAVGAYNGFIDIYYVSIENMLKYNIPMYIRGCNSVGRPHELVEHYIWEHKLSKEIYDKRPVPIITFSELCSRFDIGSIGTLKLDTEGHDHNILPEVFQFVQNNNIKTIIVEYQSYAGNTAELDEWFEKFATLGYVTTKLGLIDMKMEKV